MFFFFNDTATTEIYTLSLHDALPICLPPAVCSSQLRTSTRRSETSISCASPCERTTRSEEHTSELQSHVNLVCRLLLEKKKNTIFICRLSIYISRCNIRIRHKYH